MVDKFRYLEVLKGSSSKSNIAAMKYSFFLKDYKNKNGNSQIYLNLYIHGQRKRIPIELFIHKKQWDQKKQTVLKSCDNYIDYNLILRDIEAKIKNSIFLYRVFYFISSSISSNCSKK